MVENILFRIFCIYMVILGDFGVSAIFGETHIVLRLHLNNPHTHTDTHQWYTIETNTQEFIIQIH